MYTGVFIIREQFIIGKLATATCKSDTLATRMEWLRDEVVVGSANSTQELDLVFSPVSDSIHNQVYVCRVTRDGGMIGAQNFTADVVGKIYLMSYMYVVYT